MTTDLLSSLRTETDMLNLRSSSCSSSRHRLGGKEEGDGETERQRQSDKECKSRREDCQEDRVSGGKCEGSNRANSDGALRVLMDYRASVSGLLSQPERG